MKTYTRALIPRAQKMRREMTKAEVRLWFEVLKDFEPRVRRQRPIGGYIADFYCAACKVVIEIDGSGHFTPDGLAYDAERTAFLEGLGLRVLRLSNDDVLENLHGVAVRVTEILGSATRDPTRPARDTHFTAQRFLKREKRYTDSTGLKLSESVEKRLEAAALAAGVSSESLLEQAIDAFLAQQPRRNAKGFNIPSFVGSVQSDDPSWIDRHEDLLWNDNSDYR